MTEEVLVSVKGMQMMIDDQDEVEIVTHGKYLKKGNKHYITYEEMKLSRGTYRKCIICGCQAQECARSRKHSVEELQAKIEELLNQFST